MSCDYFATPEFYSNQRNLGQGSGGITRKEQGNLIKDDRRYTGALTTFSANRSIS